MAWTQKSAESLTAALVGFGAGVDGDVVFDGVATVLGMAPSGNVYTLTRDLDLRNCTINAGVRVVPNGFVPTISGTLRGSGQIDGNGAAGSGMLGGIAVTPTGTLQCAAGGGGAGRNTTGVGSAGTGSGGRNIAGSSGGSGGAADGGNGGGAGNASAAPTAIQGTTSGIHYALRRRLADGTSGNGGGGGGGGGCQTATGTATSGAGGAAGLPVVVIAYEIDWTGTICSDGGNGSAASATGDGKAGGGGGGAGGHVLVVCVKQTNLGTVRANGGTGGAGAGGAPAGSNGTSGRVFIVPNLK